MPLLLFGYCLRVGCMNNLCVFLFRELRMVNPFGSFCLSVVLPVSTLFRVGKTFFAAALENLGRPICGFWVFGCLVLSILRTSPGLVISFKRVELLQVG